MVATDDQRIYDAVIGFGGHAVMTNPACNNGTERCLEVLQALQAKGEKYDIVVNIQVRADKSNMAGQWFLVVLHHACSLAGC